jgi:hypothetical protein
MNCSQILKRSVYKFLATLYIYEIDINPNEFNNSLGLKNKIIGCEDVDFVFPNNTLSFTANLDEKIFNKVIQCEINSEYHRIKEQINNVNSLLKENAQPAWIVVTIYYACFFMGNLFSKLLGRTTVNFSSENLKEVFLYDAAPALSTDLRNEVISLTGGSNKSYSCLIERAAMDGNVKLRFIPGGDKPHQAVWLNFNNIISQIIKGLSTTSNNELLLLKKIFDNKDEKYPLPSQLRNNWNYSDQKYFTAQGSKEAEKFIKILKNKSSLYAWVKDQSSPKNLIIKQSSPEDKVCSLAFVYTVFLDIFTDITQALDESKRQEKIKVHLNKKKKPKRRR